MLGIISFQDGKKRAVLMGIVSYGPAICGEINTTGTYTNVQTQANFITSFIKEAYPNVSLCGYIDYSPEFRL